MEVDLTRSSCSLPIRVISYSSCAVPGIEDGYSTLSTAIVLLASKSLSMAPRVTWGVASFGFVLEVTQITETLKWDEARDNSRTMDATNRGALCALATFGGYSVSVALMQDSLPAKPFPENGVHSMQVHADCGARPSRSKHLIGGRCTRCRICQIAFG